MPKNDYSNSKLLIFSFSHAYKYTNSAFSSWIPFSIASALFQDFPPNQTHIVRISFWFWETQGSTIDSIYGLLLLSRAPQDSIDTTSKSFISSSVYIRTVKISYSKKDIFHSGSWRKLLLCLHPIIITPTPLPKIYGKFRSH